MIAVPAHPTLRPARLARAAGVCAAVTAGAAGLAGLLGGCLHVPDGPTPMCAATSDCDQAHGEVCEEGVCWGNPPPGPFAAVISPPSTRHDLVPRELPQVAIPDVGWMGDLALDAPVLLNGRIIEFCPSQTVGCDTTSIGATVTVSRRSQFQGGPGFKTVVNVAAADSFSIPVPRTAPGDDPYNVTIVPEGGRLLGTVRTPAEQVPPRRMQLGIPGTLPSSRVELGGADLPVISGSLTDSLGQGLAGYRVVALGRWDATEPVTEVSSVDFTDASGGYAVTLSDKLVGTVEIVARPPDGQIAPAVHLTSIDATQSSQRDVQEPATLGTKLDVPVAVNGLDLSGAVSPVIGATVSITGVLTKTLTSFTISDEQVTGKDGTVTLHLLNGPGITGSYRISIIPPANSTLGVMFDQKVVLPLPPQRLASRIAISGAIVDADGHPLDKVAVTARPSLRFLWTLESAPQAFVGAIPAATAVTPDTGKFLLWVDASVTQVSGDYDLLIEPPSTARAPTYVKTIELGSNGTQDSMQIGTIALPDAAFVHGRITGPDGAAVEDAEIKLYLVSTELGLCSEVANAPTSCPIPASLQGRNTSDDKGTVRLALPRPAP